MDIVHNFIYNIVKRGRIMKILLVSDTHGRLDKLHMLCKEIADIDLLLHLGDGYEDAMEVGEKYNIETVAVKGNTDGFAASDELFKIIQTPMGKIAATHGHVEGVAYSLNTLFYKAMENDCIIACFGHMHVPEDIDMGDVRLISPGSLSKPRNNSNGNYIIIHVDDVQIDIKTYEVERKKRQSGGYIRGLMNYSDRF